MPICSSRIWRISRIASASRAVVDRVCAWHRLATTPARRQEFAIILSSYPGRPHQIAHAVGLDALASTETLLGDLGEAGFDVERR